MNINLPAFKDEGTKDAITYQSWHWDWMAYSQGWVGRLHLSPLCCPFPAKPSQRVGKKFGDRHHLRWLTVLDEHYNNVKALDTLNQELFQLQMGEKETVSEWGCSCQDTSKFLQLHSQNASHQTTQLKWSGTTSMGSCLNSLRWWWHTSKQVVMRRQFQLSSSGMRSRERGSDGTIP